MLSPAPASVCPPDARAGADRRLEQVHAAETHLLYQNGHTGLIVTILITGLLVYAEWNAMSHVPLLLWVLYMLVVSAWRFMVVRRYWRASPAVSEHRRWNRLFVSGAALAGAGWGAAGVILYPVQQSIDETLLVFVIGGIMLGGASLLAARPEAFLTFLLPPGLITALRLAAEGDQQHLMMGLLAAVFTAATLTTTWRFHLMIGASLNLGFDNEELIQNLRDAKDRADALNRDLELRVADRTAKLTEADARKDVFLATLAHELRNPLAPIRFALQSLGSGAPPASAERAREVIDRQLGQLVRLVDDLLDVSRITANKMTLRPEPHELTTLMATAAESILPLATAADQTMDVRLPAAAVWVEGDGARLIQVFANVLNNAVKFTPRGGHIRFTAERRSDEVVVRINDTGVGIAADVLPRVFDMFEQAEPVLDRSTGGLGIGLTLARRLVEMHNGSIEVSSAGCGRGTQVEIRLPTSAAQDRPRASTAGPRVASEGTLRVLIVDDNPDAAEMLAVAVTQLGHTTRLAHDGDTAVRLATQFAFDVILLDVGLPGINGYEVARTLRAQPALAHIHIAAVTGWGQDEDRRKAREAGFDSHFTKPLSPDVLERLLVAIEQHTAWPGQDTLSTPRTRHADSGPTA